MNFLLIIMKFTFFSMRIFMWPYIKICSLQQKKVCSAPKIPILLHSAKKLAFMIRTKQISCEEVIQAYISRIQEVDDLLNAVVDNRFKEALLEAKEIDKFLTVTPKTEKDIENDTPLLGVPITVKESISVLGMSNAAGVYHNETPKAYHDAEILQLCKNAGAIPLVVTNTPELCMFWETSNNVTGTTKNPYDVRRTVGGSSGGEAALLGSGSSLIGLGSDICGSLRLPTMFTGVFGHKPTSEIISIQDHVPGCDDEIWSKIFVLGPMTRYAEDMELIFPVITKPEKKSVLRLNETIFIKDIKFFYMEVDTNRETILAMREFVKYLKTKYGIVAQKADLKLMKKSSSLFLLSLGNYLPINHIHYSFYDEIKKKYSIWNHIFRYITCRSKVSSYVILFSLINAASKYFKNTKQSALQSKENLEQELQTLLGSNGVLLYPTFTNVAHFHNEIFYKVIDTGYLSIFNILGFPATNCPMGYNSEGLPFGVQVTALRNNDRLTITVAKEIEKVLGGWKPPLNKN